MSGRGREGRRGERREGVDGWEGGGEEGGHTSQCLLCSYIPVLMAQAKIYWDMENYGQVEKVCQFLPTRWKGRGETCVCVHCSNSADLS